jgi:Leucine-rich repeat (LRR) protein
MSSLPQAVPIQPPLVAAAGRGGSDPVQLAGSGEGTSKKQRDLVEEIKTAGGWVSLYVSAPPLLCRLLGDDLFLEVTETELSGSTVSDAMLEHIGVLAQLHTLILGYTKLSDVGVQHIKGLTQLRRLDLCHTKVSGAGLENLARLRWLNLDGTQLRDPELEHLKGLPQLETLLLSGTKVTDAGVADLQKALPKTHIVR